MLRLINAENMTSLTLLLTISQLVTIKTSGDWCVRQVNCPFLELPCKQIVDVLSDSRERQWFYQRLSLAVVKRNVASILACEWVWSYFTHHSSVHQPVLLPNTCLPSMNSCCLLNICVFGKLYYFLHALRFL